MLIDQVTFLRWQHLAGPSQPHERDSRYPGSRELAVSRLVRCQSWLSGRVLRTARVVPARAVNCGAAPLHAHGN